MNTRITSHSIKISTKPKVNLNLSLGLALGLATAISSFSNYAAFAQIPGIPTAPPPGQNQNYNNSSSNSASSSVMTGRVNTDIMPAEKLLSQGKYADAEGMFRDILVNNPQDLTATVGLGIALAKQFKLDGADELFDRVLNTDPNNSLAYAGKATVILNRLQSSSGTIRANKDSYLKQAEDFANQAVRLSPAQAEAHYVLGAVYKEEGKADMAASELRNATSLDPQHSYAFSTLGSIYLDQNSLAQAADSFRKAIDLNSGNSSAHYGLGATLSRMGQTDEAIKELNTSLYQFPNSWPTRMELGKAYQAQGNTVAAIKEYQLSTLIKPENVEPYLKMAEIRQDRGDMELALADLRSGLTQVPYNLDLRQQIADITLKLEKPDDAIKAYRTILQMSPGNAQAVKGLSQALYLKAQKAAAGALLASNDYEAAITTLDDAIKLNPNDMELRLAKAKLMSLSGTTPDLSTMGQPSNDGEKIAYSQALMAAGKFQDAGSMMSSVIQDLTDPKQIYAAADMASMMHLLDPAEAAYKKALSLSGSPDRGKRGLDAITQQRQSALDAVKVAEELQKKKQFDGALSKFRQSIAANPVLPQARFDIAQTLEKAPKASSSMLSEAAQQYQYYLALATDMPSKDRDKLSAQVSKLADRAAKLKQKEAKSKR